MREKDKYQIFTQYYPLCTLQNSDRQDLNLDIPASIAWALCDMWTPPSTISWSPKRHSSLLITESCFLSTIRGHGLQRSLFPVQTRGESYVRSNMVVLFLFWQLIEQWECDPILLNKTCGKPEGRLLEIFLFLLKNKDTKRPLTLFRLLCVVWWFFLSLLYDVQNFGSHLGTLKEFSLRG